MLWFLDVAGGSRSFLCNASFERSAILRVNARLTAVRITLTY